MYFYDDISLNYFQYENFIDKFAEQQKHIIYVQ